MYFTMYVYRCYSVGTSNRTDKLFYKEHPKSHNYMIKLPFTLNTNLLSPWYRILLIMTTKESLNSDGQQFHLYQQNEQSPLTSSHWTKLRLRHMTLEIQVMAYISRSDTNMLWGLIGNYYILWTGGCRDRNHIVVAFAT